MADIDKVIEAEENIRSIANELGRMKSAADLMDSAQTKVDAVIKASSEIIIKTGEFVKEGTQIVQRIGDYDIQGDLSKIIENSNSIEAKLAELAEELIDSKASIGVLRTELEAHSDKRFKGIIDLINELKGQNKQAEKTIKGIIGVLNEVKDQNKRAQKTIIGFIGGNVLIGIVLILKIFQVF